MIHASRKLNIDSLENPGDYCWTSDSTGDTRAGLIFLCPCGCGVRGFLTIRGSRNPDEHPSWVWDSNDDSPTLTPSVLKTQGCKWHGFLTKGQWLSC